MKYIYLVVAFSIASCGQTNSEPHQQVEDQETERVSVLTSFSKEQYLQDFDQLVVALKENHPQWNEYTSEEDFSAFTEDIKNQFDDGLKVGEFIWLCRSLVSKIGCSHSVVPTLGLNFFLPDHLLFPLNVLYKDNKLYVIDPLGNEAALSKGDEILAVNGMRASEVKNEMYKHISADANNKSFKDEYINGSFMEYAAFVFKFPSKYEIEYLKDGNVKTTVLNQLDSYDEEENNQEKCENNLCYEIDGDVAVVTISSFYYYRENLETFKKFIDSCFVDIKTKQIENLIIDLRNNGGGDPYCGSYLLQHIANRPYQYYKTGTHGYTDLQQAIEPNPNRFNRKPYILINGRCASTTGQLCALIKENDCGIFVGQETGATFRCHATARPFALKSTGITPFIATRTFESNVEHLPKDKGIIPDYEVKPTISDILEKEDVALKYIKRLLLNQ